MRSHQPGNVYSHEQGRVMATATVVCDGTHQEWEYPRQGIDGGKRHLLSTNVVGVVVRVFSGVYTSRAGFDASRKSR